MTECRYYAMCDVCDRAGDDWLPCNGTDDGTVCGHFEPMPDVKALLALADEMKEKILVYDRLGLRVSTRDVMGYAHRIREACGEVGR